MSNPKDPALFREGPALARGALVRDPEVVAMAAVLRALAKLDEAARRRVLRFLFDKYGPEKETEL